MWLNALAPNTKRKKGKNFVVFITVADWKHWCEHQSCFYNKNDNDKEWHLKTFCSSLEANVGVRSMCTHTAVWVCVRRSLSILRVCVCVCASIARPSGTQYSDVRTQTDSFVLDIFAIRNAQTTPLSEVEWVHSDKQMESGSWWISSEIHSFLKLKTQFVSSFCFLIQFVIFIIST